MISDNRLPALYSYLQKSKRKRDAGRPRIRRKARFKERFLEVMTAEQRKIVEWQGYAEEKI
jgi:hypothetical protein